VLGIELEQRLRVVDRSFELGPVPNHARILHQPVDVGGVEGGDSCRTEAAKRVADAGPFRVDDAPAIPPWKTARVMAST
jgi:hypothetical protein